MTEQVEAKPVTDTEVQQEATALALQPEVGSIGGILAIIKEAAVNKTDAETMRELLNVYKDAKADQAREAYANAIVQFRRLVKPIIMTGHRDDTKQKNRDGEFGKVKYDWAELTTTIEQIHPILDQCQLTPTWRVVGGDANMITVECIVTHLLGHKESSGPFPSPIPPNAPRGQTPVQVRMGVVTSIKRATLFMVLGLTTKEDDRHLQNAEQGQEPAKAKSAELTNPDPDEQKARDRFRDIAERKLGAKMTGGALHKLLANVQQASDKDAVSDCADFIDTENVLIGKDGTIGFVQEDVDPAAFDTDFEPGEAAAVVDAAAPAEPNGNLGVVTCSAGHVVKRTDVIASPLAKGKGQIGLCPTCKKNGNSVIIKE